MLRGVNNNIDEVAGSESVEEDVPRRAHRPAAREYSHTAGSLKSLIKQGYQDWENYKREHGRC